LVKMGIQVQTPGCVISCCKIHLQSIPDYRSCKMEGVTT